MAAVLYYDHDPVWRDRAGHHFSTWEGFEQITAYSFDEATVLLRSDEFATVVADPAEIELLALHAFLRLLPRPVPLVLFMKPGAEALAIQAVDGGARYIEKSGDPEDRFRAVRHLVETLCRRRDEDVSLRRQNENLALLSRTAMDLVGMEDDTDIYRYIADEVHGIVPEGFVNILLFDPGSRLLTVHTIVPEAVVLPILRVELGHDLVGKSFPIDASPAAETMLGCNRIVEGATSMYYGTMQTLPEEACRRIEERLDLGRYYSMGFTCREGLYGVLTITVRKGRELEPEQRELIEVFVRQTSVALLRHHSRARLKESEARYRAVVESQHELVCRFRPDGTHLFANEAYCRFFGLDPATVAGTRFEPSIPEDEREALRDYFRGFSPERPDAMNEHRVFLADGTARWLQWSDRAFFNRDDRVEEVQSVGRDVTERKEAENALAMLTAELEDRVETATAELRVANRDLEAFSHHVSHDLRAPLRAIDGYLGVLMARFGSDLPDDVIVLVGKARTAATRAGRFLEGLLALARLSHQAAEPGRDRDRDARRGRAGRVPARSPGPVRRSDRRVHAALPRRRRDAAARVPEPALERVQVHADPEPGPDRDRRGGGERRDGLSRLRQRRRVPAGARFAGLRRVRPVPRCPGVRGLGYRPAARPADRRTARRQGMGRVDTERGLDLLLHPLGRLSRRRLRASHAVHEGRGGMQVLESRIPRFFSPANRSFTGPGRRLCRGPPC